MHRGWFYTFWTCSPLSWVEIVHYGHFDMLLAALCAFALITWITIYQLLYWLHGDFTNEPWIGMRDIAGAITFPLAMAILWLSLKTSWARSMDSFAVPRHEAARTPNLTNP